MTVAAETYFGCHAVGVAYLVIFAETVVGSIEVHLVNVSSIHQAEASLMNAAYVLNSIIAFNASGLL